jgi:hypothetical protein
MRIRDTALRVALNAKQHALLAPEVSGQMKSAEKRS